MTTDAMQALYEGDVERAKGLLPPDDALDVFHAAAFGRTARLRDLLDRTNTISEDGFTPLHLAVYADQPDAARLLIDAGADVDALSTGAIARVPPLGTAAFVGSARMAALLLDAGADVNRRGEVRGFTPLHSAAANGDAELVRLLLARGADPAARTTDGKTPSDLAAGDEIRALLG